jgi:hypothetical protein
LKVTRMMNSIWRNLLSNFRLTPCPVTLCNRRVTRRWEFASERLEDRVLLSAGAVAPAVAEIGHARGVAGGHIIPSHSKAANVPSIAGDWLLTGIAVSGTFTDASLTIIQSGKTGKTITGSSTFSGGSFQLTGKLRPNGHMTGKATIQLGQTTLAQQRYFADFTDDFLTFSGEVNLKPVDDLMNIDGVRQV